MIVFIEPISTNIDMYVPAYPLPLLEIASFVKSRLPRAALEIISLPVDYGLPLTAEGRETVYAALLADLAKTRPTAVGISCTAISQAEEMIRLCGRIKAACPETFIFLGGYFPTLYYEDIFDRTDAVDLIVIGEGEYPCLKIVESLETGRRPENERIPGLAWKSDGKVRLSEKGARFDLKQKAVLDPGLLRHPRAYDITPYSFSRGCGFKCHFCMEEFIRPRHRKVPRQTIETDLQRLSDFSNSHTLLISDALFQSFDLFPVLRTMNRKIHFETRCDVLPPDILADMADAIGIFAMGLESASYDALRRMNKVKNRSHYESYLQNAEAIFTTAVKHQIPIMVFMIAGYPGDTRADLQQSLDFARRLARHQGPGGHVFKIGECRVYPKTKSYRLARELEGVVFEDNGVFGENIVRRPSAELEFETVLKFMGRIFQLSHMTPKLRQTLRNLMPFFRIPAQAFEDEMIPGDCFVNGDRNVLNAHGKSLSAFRAVVPALSAKYGASMSGQRSTRTLTL